MSEDNTRIIMDCPFCRKRLHVPLKYIGTKVGCRHCLQPFKVRDPAASQFNLSDSGLALLNRVDEVLGQAPPPPKD